MGGYVTVANASSPWNSYTIASLGVAFLTPLLLFSLGLIVTRAARRIEDAQWAGRKLIERRLELHKEMAPILNDVYCFFTTRGHFRDITPLDALEKKRQLDKLFHTNNKLFSSEFQESYYNFMRSCFIEYSRLPEDAHLNAQSAWMRQQRSYKGWDPQWDDRFVEMTTAKSKETVEEQKTKYEALMTAFAGDLGVVRPPAGRR
jgi:hypothetical protein